MKEEKVKEPEFTLLKYYETLTANEKALIALALKTYARVDAHAGSLPFFKMRRVINSLILLAQDQQQRAMLLRLIAKLDGAKHGDLLDTGTDHFPMSLNDAKVIKKLGVGLSRALLLPWCRGMAKSTQKQYFHISRLPLSRAKRQDGLYQIKVAAEYRLELELWLMEHCQ